MLFYIDPDLKLMDDLAIPSLTFLRVMADFPLGSGFWFYPYLFFIILIF